MASQIMHFLIAQNSLITLSSPAFDAPLVLFFFFFFFFCFLGAAAGRAGAVWHADQFHPPAPLGRTQRGRGRWQPA